MTATARPLLLIMGHPDGSAPHLCHALAEAHADGAREAGHAVRSVDRLSGKRLTVVKRRLAARPERGRSADCGDLPLHTMHLGLAPAPRRCQPPRDLAFDVPREA